MSRHTPGGGFDSTAQAAWFGGQFHDAKPRPRRGRPPKQPAAPTGREPLPEIGNPAWGAPIYGSDLTTGDTIVYLGRHHTIDRFENYKGELSGVLGEGARTAYSGTWDMAIGPDAIIRILPRDGA